MIREIKHFWSSSLSLDQTLTGEPISRLSTVLWVPVNVQEGNSLKHKNIHCRDDLFGLGYQISSFLV